MTPTVLPLSVVLPVYHRVPVDQFQRAIGSLRDQTTPAAEIIVVSDGPLPEPLDAAVEAALDDSTHLVRLPENKGVAQAMQAGILAATHDWIARQDSDDISLAHRFETMWPYAQSGTYAAIGADMLEFVGSESNVVGRRSLPRSPAALRRYAKWNSPINNPTVILSRTAVLAVGGVKHVYLMEDYDLFARLLAGGHQLINVPEALVLFRADPAVFARRVNKGTLAAELEMARRLHSYGISNLPQAALAFSVRSAARSIPPAAFASLYALVFRSHPKKGS